MVKLRTVLGVLAFAIVASLFGTTVRVHAAYSDLANNPYSQVKSYLYVEGLVECSRNGKTNISNADALSGNWFSQGNIPFGAALFPPTGSVTCDNGWIDGALSFWGITEKRALLCELAGRGGTCATDGSPITLKQTNADVVRRAISQRFYGGASTDLSAPAYYILFKETFIKGCQASPYAEVGKLNSDQQSVVNSDPDHYRVLSIVDDATGNVSRWYYKTVKGYNAGIATVATWGDRDCQQLETEMNNRADTYAQWVKGIIASGGAVAGGTSGGTGTGNSPNDTCKIDGIGWIVCPFGAFLSKVTDGAYGAVEKLLIFKVSDDPFSTDPAVNPIYTIWSNIRNLANIAFVVALFVVIFSQATSMGISSYGIRKMLPRIIVAAILVNLSYYICLFAIDMSNIIGAGLDGIIKSVPLANLPGANDGTWEKLMAGAMAGAIGGVALGLAVVFATGLVLAFLATALLAILTALVVLLARHALLIMLIVLAPLAFVANILPGTEEWAKKWQKLFTTLLVMYPLVAILFAGTKVASSIMQTTANSAPGGTGWLMQLFSLGVLAIPLFGIPFIVKFSGGLLGRVAGIVNNRNKGLIDRARKMGEGGAQTRRGELGSNMRTAKNWGRNEDGSEKKGTFNRFKRGLGGGIIGTGAAKAGNYSRDRQQEQKSRQAAVEREFSVGRAKRLTGDLEEDAPNIEDYKNADGSIDKIRYTQAVQDYQQQSASAQKSADRLRRRAAGVGGERGADSVRAAALSAVKKEFDEHTAEYQKTYSLSPQGADFGINGFLEKELKEAIAKGNEEKAVAVINRLTNLGAGGRAALRRMLTGEYVTTDANGAKIATRIEPVIKANTDSMKQVLTTSILEDNFNSLQADSGDIVKGDGFDKSGRWRTEKLAEDGSVKGYGINSLKTEVLAQQDLHTILINQSRITRDEARRIVTDDQIRSKITTKEALETFHKIAGIPLPKDGSQGSGGTQQADSGTLFIPRSDTRSQPNTPPTSTQQQREAGGNFNTTWYTPQSTTMPSSGQTPTWQQVNDDRARRGEPPMSWDEYNNQFRQ